MKWSEIDDKERARLILQRVMGCFVLEATATGWRTPELKGNKPPDGFHWPIAFWNTDGECWMTRDIATDPTSFDPLHDMNDAWLVVEKMKTPDTDPGWEGNHSRFADFSDNLQREGSSVFDVLWHLTPEAICSAALRALGVEIEE